MEPGSIAIVTGLMGVLITITEVLKHFVLKKKPNGKNNYGNLTPEQANQLSGVSKFCTQFEVRWDHMKEELKEMRQEQQSSNKSVDKLVASQERVVERMIELITKMDRVLERRVE